MAGTWSDAFAAAFGDAADFSLLVAAISDRTGRGVSEEWVAARIEDSMSHLLLYAPCQRNTWLSPADLPDRVMGVLGAALGRAAVNPDGIRTIQAGEFSQTWAGSAASIDDIFTATERRIIGVEAGCGGGLMTIRATVDPPIPGFRGVTEALEMSQPQPEELR